MVAGKCKWEMKVINQMGSKGEEGNAAGRICCWVLRGRATEPGFSNGLFSARVWLARRVPGNAAPVSGCVNKCKAKLLSTGRVSPQCSECSSHSSTGEQEVLTSSYSLFALSFQQAQAEKGLLEGTVPP